MLDDLNPFIILRHRARNELGLPLTQADLARLSGVSEQYIRRQETGLINSPSSKVSETLVTLAPDFRNIMWNSIADLIMESGLDYPFPRNQLVLTARAKSAALSQWYKYWVMCRRHLVNIALADFDPTPCRNIAQLVDAVTLALNEPQTVYAFCKILALHPYTVQRALSATYLDGETGVLRVALQESGIIWGIDRGMDREVTGVRN